MMKAKMKKEKTARRQQRRPQLKDILQDILQIKYELQRLLSKQQKDWIIQELINEVEFSKKEV